jgi:hypothetical protein
MWIVKVPFKYQNSSGKLINAKPGDELPEFDKWPYVVKKAHLNLGWVVEEKDKPQDNNLGKGHPFKK